jgi:flagellar assembly factor FliW
VNIATTRFGEIDIDESKIIDMQGEILGFEHLKKYILHMQDDKTPFWWFQSLDDGAIAFVVINPLVVKPDYEPVISDDDVQCLGIESVEDVVLMAIVTIRSNPVTVSVNLRAPIVINSRNKLAKQVVLDDPEYPVQYYLTKGEVSDKQNHNENIEKPCGKDEGSEIAAV